MSSTETAPRILIADDQPDVLESLRLLLKPEGFVVETAESPEGVLAAVRDRDFDTDHTSTCIRVDKLSQRLN